MNIPIYSSVLHEALIYTIQFFWGTHVSKQMCICLMWSQLINGMTNDYNRGQDEGVAEYSSVECIRDIALSHVYTASG